MNNKSLVVIDLQSITSYDKKKLPEMLEYYAQKGCIVESLSEVKI